MLYTREFVWLVANDDNRVEDGKQLRHEFLEMQGDELVDHSWLELGCSMLEMLIALARRAAFESDMSPVEWFGIFITNMGLDGYTDANFFKGVEKHIDIVLDRIIFRTYAPNGEGGLFPQIDPTQDQRDVELWYQLSEYLLERYPIV